MEFKVDKEAFELLDRYQEESYRWSLTVVLLIRPCLISKSIDWDLLPYSFAWIWNTFDRLVMHGGGIHFDEVLEEEFNISADEQKFDDIWNALQRNVDSIGTCLTQQYSENQIVETFVSLLAHYDEDDDVLVYPFNTEEELKLRQFISNKLSY
jgi:hypothetical protein